jgi:hypothetical protein
MTGLGSIFTALWPFFNEVVLGNKSIRDFIKEHKWVFGNLLCSLVLFLFFINQYLINVHEQITDVEAVHGSTVKILDLTNRNNWQAEKIKLQEELILKMAGEYKELSSSCKPVVNKPPPSKSVPSKPIGTDILDRENLERLERLRKSATQFNGA